MRFFRGLAEIIALLAILAIISTLSAPLGFLFCVGIFFVGLFAVIKPLPRLRLPSRPYNLAVALLVGLVGTGIPATLANMETARLAELRANDPSGYLAELQKSDREKWLEELKLLDPEAYESEQAAEALRKSEAERAAAAEKAKIAAERADQERLEAEAKAKAANEEAELARAEALKTLEADKKTLQQQVDRHYWEGASKTLAKVKRTGALPADLVASLEETAALAVKEIPSADLERNRLGYQFLSELRPENTTYAAKVADYQSRIAAARKAAIAKLRATEDKIEGITFFQHPNKPKYLNSRSTVYLYIARNTSGGLPLLRMKVQYTADEWLFVERVYAWHDGVKEELYDGSFSRDNNTTIWEWVDVPVNSSQVAVINGLANAKESILRFEGQQYRKDVTLSARDKEALRDVLVAFEVMATGG